MSIRRTPTAAAGTIRRALRPIAAAVRARGSWLRSTATRACAAAAGGVLAATTGSCPAAALSAVPLARPGAATRPRNTTAPSV